MYKAFVFFILFLILSPITSADTNSGKRVGVGKKTDLESASKNSDTIRGICIIIESATNPVASTCMNLLLILNDLQGNEMMRTRTTAQGQFEFSADSGKAYRIISGSKFYELVSPTSPIHGGDKIQVQLQQN